MAIQFDYQTIKAKGVYRLFNVSVWTAKLQKTTWENLPDGWK